MNDHEIPLPMRMYPSPDITPGQFEVVVADLFRQTAGNVDDLEVSLHEKVRAPDGTYDIDATVRFSVAGMSTLR